MDMLSQAVADDGGFSLRCLDCGCTWADTAPTGKPCPGCLSHCIVFTEWDVLVPWV